MRFMNDKRGVTLLELMIVVAIMGVMATIAVPAYYAWLPKLKVDQAIFQLSDDLQYARLRSISENIPWEVQFNIANNSYSIYRDPNNTFDPNNPSGTASLVKTVQLVDNSSNYMAVRTVVFGYNVTYGPYSSILQTGGASNAAFNSQHYEKFLPDGTAQFDGAVYLIPQEDLTAQRYDRNRAITVTGLTGFIKTWQHDASKSGSWE